MVLSVSIKTTKALAQVVDIGTVEQVSGYARIERDKNYDVVTDFGIQSYDKAQTEAGRMGIRFVDDTTIRITDNMLLIAPPEEDKEQEEKQSESKQDNNLLDFGELDIDYLADDSLDKDELEFTELDYDALNVNFLEDLLDIITELDVLDNEEELTQTISAVNIEGTSIGQDQKTQITTVVSGQEIKLTREVAQSTSIQIDSGESYLVVLEQDGVMNQVKVNGGGSSVIVIKQSQ